MNTKNRALLISTIAYIYIPVMIFLIGFVKPYFSFPLILVLSFFLLRMIEDYQKEMEENKTVLIKWWVLLLAVLVLCAFCVFIGWGGWFPQAGDWYKHNAVLRDLSMKNWPVYYMNLEPSMLTYYIGQYLVPALVGKLTGSFRIAEILFFVWGVIGLVLVFIHLQRILKADTVKKQLLSLLILLFFSGAVVLTQVVLHNWYPNMTFAPVDRHWVIVGEILLQFRSNFVMLRWVFPQCMIPWLLMMLFMEHYKKCEYYALLFLPALLFATFSFVSFFAYALMGIVYLLIKQKDKKDVLKRIFSLSNLLPAVGLGGILFFYFLGYVQVQKPDYLGFGLQKYGFSYWGVYVVFCFFAFGIYAVCVWKDNKKIPLYYFTVILLLVIPLFKMGLCNDFVMSVSIPPLFVLMIFVVKFLNKKGESEQNGIKKGILIVCLFIGAWYSFCELKDNIAQKEPGIMSAAEYESLGYFTNRGNQELSDDLKYNYYTYDLEGKIFYEYIARKKIGEN